MAKQSNLELAANVFWGECVDYTECNLRCADTPESLYRVKESVSKLSEESKLMVDTILNLPDEIYTNHGTLIMREVRSYMMRRYSWTPKKVDKCHAEIMKAFGGSYAPC